MAYTTTGTVDYVQTAYDMLAYFALRPELYFDQVADVKPTSQSMAGSSVVFNIQNDMALATTALNESTDITPVALTSSQVTLTLAEYGDGTHHDRCGPCPVVRLDRRDSGQHGRLQRWSVCRRVGEDPARRRLERQLLRRYHGRHPWWAFFDHPERHACVPTTCA